MANFTPITFEGSTLTAVADGIFQRAHFADGVLSGAQASVSGGNILITKGEYMLCGRLVRLDGQYTLTPTISGTYAYGRLILQVVVSDTTEVSIEEEYSTTSTFTDLIQEDLNDGGDTYQIEMCQFSIANQIPQNITKQGARSYAKTLYYNGGSALGGSVNPIYINANGVPVACTPYSQAIVAGLTTNAGSAINPVYFANGIPVACTSYANAFVKGIQSSSYNLGNATTPIYLKNGIPVECSTFMSTGADVNPTATNAFNIGSSSLRWLAIYANSLNLSSNLTATGSGSFGSTLSVGGSITTTATTADLGSSSKPWRYIYGALKGNADTATTATTANKTSKALTINSTVFDGSTARSFSLLSLAGGTMTGTLNSQSIVPKADNTYNCGSSSGNKWAHVYTHAVNSGEGAFSGAVSISGTLTAHSIAAASANTYNIGASNKRFKNIYTNSGDFDGTLSTRNITPTLNGVNIGDSTHYYGYTWSQFFSSPSDKNVKEGILALSAKESKELILNLNPSKFKYKTGCDDNYHWGLIAQEVKSTLDQNNSDFGGYIEGEVCALNYIEFIAPLIKVVQEQQQTINNLKSRLEAIENDR